MKTRKNVTQSVTFSWRPEAFPVRWAYTTEEVPPWDITRGFPANAPIGLGLVELEIKEADVPKPVFRWLMPHPILEVPEHTSDIEMLRTILREHPEYRDRADEWKPSPPPAKGYPRLVRETFTKDALGGSLRNGIDVIAELQSVLCDDDKDPPILKPKMNEIAQLASFFGAPEGTKHNTLEAWLRLIWRLKGHLQVMEALQLYGLEEVRKQARENELRADALITTRQRESIGEQEVIRVWQDMYDILRRERFRDEVAFRLSVARALQLDFRWQLEEASDGYSPVVPALNNFDFEGSFGVRAWSIFCLRNKWLNPGNLRRCEGCGNVFVSRKNALCCHSRCRKRKKEKIARSTQL